MKTFKDLQIGDKIFIDHHSTFIHDIKYKDGYMAIQTHYEKDAKTKPWLGWYFIPMNHLKANKIKYGKYGVWIHISERGYKKIMMEFIKNQIER